MTPLDYDFLRSALKQRSGLVLSADKQYLVESRLLPVARKAGLANLGALVEALRSGGNDPLMVAVVEAMATNESFFFRDKIPFEHFRTIIMPALLAARRASRAIRIWCAADLDRAGTVFARHVPEGHGARDRRLARRDRRHRPVK